MSITLNGQLLLCLLAENVMQNVPGVKIIQCNTDGMTVSYSHRSSRALQTEPVVGTIDQVDLGAATYQKMCIRDVNNYIRQYLNSKVKRKGAAVRAGVAPEPQRTGGPEGRGEGAAEGALIHETLCVLARQVRLHAPGEGAAKQLPDGQ